MPTVISRLKAKLPTVADVEDKSLLPHFQSVASVGQREHFIVPIQPAAPTNSFSNGATLYYDLEPHEVREVSDIVVRLKISATSDTRIVGCPYLFDRIVIEGDHGSGPEIARIYPETIVAWNMLTENDETQQKCAEMGNYSLKKVKSKNLRKYYTDESNYIRANQSKEIYLPLPLNWIKYGALHLGHIKNDIRFRFECSNSVVIDGSASNLSLDAFDFLISSHSEEEFDAKANIAQRMKHKHSFIFLEPERLQINTKTYTASNKTEIFLDQFTGKIAFMLVVLKPSTTPTASDKTLFDYREIGPYGTFDLENSAGKSLLANGTPINQNQLYTQFHDQIGSRPWQGVYIIPFCEDIKKSIAGHINGFYQARGSKDKLCIVPDSAPTQEVVTISTGATASAGTYRYAFENCGGISDQEVDYNDSTSDLLSAINAMPQLADIGLSASAVNANLDATTSQTVTFDAKCGSVYKELGKLTIVGNGIPKVNSSSVTTFGKDGFTTGSNFTCEIFAFKFCKLIIDQQGNLSKKEL